MPRVVPSQAVQVIDTLFPQFRDQADSQQSRISLHPGDVARVRAVVDLVDSIPADLISLDPNTYSRFAIALSVLKTQVEEWTMRGNTGKLERVAGFGNLNPITIVRRALVYCKDEPIHTVSGDLNFISDPDLRDNIWADTTAVRRALSNHEWKATTVLAGSVLEALLLWAISKKPPVDVEIAITDLIATKDLAAKPESNHEKWNLDQYIRVANSLKLISDSGKTQMLLAKDFRNLIHPGRSARLGQTCDRATAYTSVAAIENVIRDLRNAF